MPRMLGTRIAPSIRQEAARTTCLDFEADRAGTLRTGEDQALGATLQLPRGVAKGVQS